MGERKNWLRNARNEISDSAFFAHSSVSLVRSFHKISIDCIFFCFSSSWSGYFVANAEWHMSCWKKQRFRFDYHAHTLFNENENAQRAWFEPRIVHFGASRVRFSPALALRLFPFNFIFPLRSSFAPRESNSLTESKRNAYAFAP